MKQPFIAYLFLFSMVAFSCRRHDNTVPATAFAVPAPDRMKINDAFWSPLTERNRTATIPYIFLQCEETGRIDNFAIAGGLMEGKHRGERYNDSDVFKAIEAACNSLMSTPDDRLREYVDSLVVLIAAAQEDDGYIYTTRTIDSVNMAPGAGRERWTDERVSHELYNVGHLYEAAVAHYSATGSDVLLNVALRNATLVNSEFGWGRRETAPGHQEIEIGLIKLFRVTGDKRWLDLAQFFIDVRGREQNYLRHPAGSRFDIYNDSVYLQMHMPVLDQKEAAGHAVRAAYMYTALADLSEATGDNKYLEASRTLWDDVVKRKLYITGGIGSVDYGEAFGEPFDLPNQTAYTETCASVGNVFWNYRLFLATGESMYLDVLERTLYNGLISGIGADGCRFFYTNPLESDGSVERAGWFDCSCCPANVARFLPTLRQYIYSTADNSLSVNLFIGSEATLDLKAGRVSIRQTTGLPWTGDVSLAVEPAANGSRFRVLVRIPAWTGEKPVAGDLYSYITPAGEDIVLKINGIDADITIDHGFAVIDRKWNAGDVVDIIFPMNPRFIAARDEVKADSGRVAAGLGPLVYCLEQADNGKVREVKADTGGPVDLTDTTLFGNKAKIIVMKGTDAAGGTRRLRAVPYYLWANRGSGEMIVWMRTNKQQ